MRPAARGKGAKRAKAPLKGTVTHIDDAGKKTEFDLELAPVKGEVPERVVEELMLGKQRAQDMAAAFSDAAKAMAEKYGVKVGALKKFVSARVADKIEDTRAEADDLVKLLDA